jgi:hypothetical protein
MDGATRAAWILKNLARKARFTRAHAYDLSSDASLLTGVQQKSKPRNARREIFVVACAEIPRVLRLCRKLDSGARQEQARKMAAKSTPPKSKNNRVINSFNAG